MINKVVERYLNLEISHEEFIYECFKNSEIIDWLEGLICESREKGVEPTDEISVKILIARGATFLKEKPIAPVLSEFFPRVKDLIAYYARVYDGLSARSSLYGMIFNIVVTKYPDTKYNTKYYDMFCFGLKAIPEWAHGGEEAINYIDKNILSQLPENLSYTKKINLCKQLIKEHFHMTGYNYPRWVQGAEWPIINGKPGRYIGKTRNGDLVKYSFEDVTTGEIVVVEQYY